MSRSSSELRSSSEQCMNTKRAAFQSLLQKLRYPSQRARSKLILRPGVASDAQVKRTASAPNAGMPLGNVVRVSLAIASLCFGLNKPWVRFSTRASRGDCQRNAHYIPQWHPGVRRRCSALHLCIARDARRNINFDLARCEGYRNFCNKLWNAARFVFIHCSDDERNSEDERDIQNAQSRADRWILSTLQRVSAAVEKHFADFRFDLIAQSIYQFIWDEYCDWYIEFAKVQLQTGTQTQQRVTRHTLLHALETSLRLAHPLMPFITEALWQSVAPLVGRCRERPELFATSLHKEQARRQYGDRCGRSRFRRVQRDGCDPAAIPNTENAEATQGKPLKKALDSIMVQPYPRAQPEKIDPDAERWVAQLKTAIEACRTLRGEIQLSPGARAPLFASGDEALLTAFAPYMRALARLSDVRHCADESALNQAASGAPVAFAGALKMALKADTDPVAERARLDKEIRRIEAELSKCRVKLSNEAFVSKAPEVIVGQERKRASEYEAVRDALIAQRARI